MIDDIENYQLKWNQHVLWVPENRIPRKALQYRPQGKGDLGRPYRRWKERMEEEEEEEDPSLRLSSFNINECPNLQRGNVN